MYHIKISRAVVLLKAVMARLLAICPSDWEIFRLTNLFPLNGTLRWGGTQNAIAGIFENLKQLRKIRSVQKFGRGRWFRG